MKLIAFTLTIGLFVTCSAYAVSIDSLIDKSAGYRHEDTVRATILNDLAIAYSSVDYELGLIYADSSIALCKKIHSDLKLATAYYAKGRNLNMCGMDSLAIVFYQQSYNLNKQLNRLLPCGTMLQNMGISYYNLSNYKMAIDKYQDALSVFKDFNNERGIAVTYNSLGVVSMEVGDYTQAMNYYFESLKMSKQMADSSLMANCYTNMGIVYKNLGDLNKALMYQNKAYQIQKALNNRFDMAKSYNNIAIVFSEMKQAHKALEFYNKALEINKELNYEYGIASNLINIGIQLRDIGQFTPALKYINEAEQLFEKIDDKNNYAMCLKAKATLLINAPDSALTNMHIAAAKRFEVCQNILSQSITLFNETGDLSSLADVNDDMSKLYQKIGDYKNALFYYRQHILFRDSVFIDEKKIEIEKRELQFDYETIEQQLKLINIKKQAELDQEKLNKRYTIAGGIVLLLVATGSFISFQRRRNAIQKRKEAELNAQRLEADLKALRLQMNPHFMFNSLNSIADFIDKDKSQAASTFSVKFAKLMRMILENSDKPLISLSDEIKTLELYLSLEALRLNARLQYAIQVDPNLDAENYLIPPMLIQPFVENSILHGIVPLNGLGLIEIKIECNHEMLCITVMDNGVGMGTADHTMAGKKSMAMKITNERIALFNKQNNTQASVQLERLSPGTCVKINFPMIASF
jgi:tetratricopeptide (TPR) repeat protein